MVLHRLARKRSGRLTKVSISLQPMVRCQPEFLQSLEVTDGEKVILQPVQRPTLEQRFMEMLMVEQAVDSEKGRDSEEDLNWGLLLLGEPLTAGASPC